MTAWTETELKKWEGLVETFPDLEKFAGEKKVKDQYDTERTISGTLHQGQLMGRGTWKHDNLFAKGTFYKDAIFGRGKLELKPLDRFGCEPASIRFICS